MSNLVERADGQWARNATCVRAHRGLRECRCRVPSRWPVAVCLKSRSKASRELFRYAMQTVLVVVRILTDRALVPKEHLATQLVAQLAI